VDPFGLSGTLLEGQYRIDDVVGEGGFGVVYRGRHLALEQPIAIKVLKGLDGGEPTINAFVLEKFRAEARLLYTLSQSSLNVVRALDSGALTTPSGAWAPFMILEWLEGRSLAEDLADRRVRGLRGRSLTEAFAILEPVAEGLRAAHEQHVAHRDIKPANVFLLGNQGKTPSGPRVKVLDFGLAKIMKDGEAAGTKGTFASFTWLYAAPEQLEPRLGPTGLATDVYGFVLLLTELMTDRPPADDPDVVHLMRSAMARDRRPTPRARGANVPDAVEAVSRRALAVDPAQRFANVPELWAALVAARDGEGGRVSTVMQTAVPASIVSSTLMVKTPAPGSYAAVVLPTATSQSEQAARSPPRGTLPPPRLTPIPQMPMGPPPRTTPVPNMPMGPPPGTLPPGFPATQRPGWGQWPPPGTARPGPPPATFPSASTSGASPALLVTVAFILVAALGAGLYAMLSGACHTIR
jgi:serine/threonine protein kinase